MIKKYRQYNEKVITNFLSKDELEDHFLRLEEIYGCEVNIQLKCSPSDSDKSNGVKYVGTYYLITLKPMNKMKPYGYMTDDIKEELETVKKRLEAMYPVRIQYGGSEKRFFVVPK